MGAFDVIDIRRSPDRINGFEVEVSGTGRPGKVAVLVYAETFTAPTQRADAYTLDEDNDMSTVVQTAAGANATLNLPEAVRNLIGAEFIIRVNNAPNTLVIDSHVNDRIVRVSADRAEEEEKDKVQSNTANAFIVLACREAHRWIIEAETPRTATGALPWTLTN